MRSYRTRNFKKLFAKLPQFIQQDAVDAYRLFQQNPAHPLLKSKTISVPRGNLYGVELQRGYRAVAVLLTDYGTRVYEWDFIGSHADYDTYIR